MSPEQPLLIGGLLDRKREFWSDMMRFLASSVWLPWVLIKRPEATALWGPMLAIPVITLGAVLAAHFDLFPRWRRLAVAVLDVCLLNYVVWALGASTTPVLVFLVMTVIASTMSGNARVGLVTVVAVLALYGTVLLLEARGVIPVAPMARPDLGPHETSGGRPFAFVSVAISVVAAYLFLLFMRARLERAASLERELRLAEKAAQQKALELERQLELAQRMESLGRLAGGVAHDFNNLLTVVHGAFAYAIVETKNQGEVSEALEDGLNAARRAANLTQQLLAFSRRQPVRPQVIDPGQALNRTRRMLQRVIGEDVTIHLDLATDLWPVRVDPVQMEQVFLNLAVNARDAMPGGGKLSIHAQNVTLSAADAAERPGTVPGPYVEFQVTDTGCGMDPETLRRAVEPFFTTKPQGRGTGLGLSTVFGILQQNGGWMGLSSRVGQGTTITLLLPRSEGTPVLLPLEAPVSVRGRETVLVVEDEESLRRMVKKALERSGYTVLEAPTGEAALQTAGRHDGGIEVLVTDLVMPGISGKALAEQMRRARPGLKVLFMSGYSPEALDQEALLTDGAQFLPKPFEPEHLALHVRQLIDSGLGPRVDA